MSTNPVTGRLEHFAQAVAERVVSLVLEAIDFDALLERIDVEQIIDRVDIGAVVERVDIDGIVERVDIQKIVDRIDIDGIVERVDIQKIIDRVDVNAIVAELDVDALVRQTELGSIIARSTTGVLTEVLDLVRSSGVGLDDFCARLVNRVLRRDPATLPLGPPLLVGPAAAPALTAAPEPPS